MLLQGKTAVVTGCNRGIGRAILETFAEHGADILACARKESPEFSAMVAALASTRGVSVIPVYLDLMDVEQVKAGVRSIVSSRRRIDAIVNNAGVPSGSLFQMTSFQELRRVFEVNFFGQLLFTQGLSRYMCRFRSGSIINIASVAGLIGHAGTIGYGSSKAALIAATRTMATELGDANIRVNAIAPSITRTDMLEQMDQQARARLLRASALKRPAEPCEIANVALFLASDLSTFLTGQVLRVDGGLAI